MAVPEIIDVSADNVDKTGFFCKMSARGKPGYERKLSWLKKRFAEGMGMKLLGGGERGFIEYIPGRHAWRAIEGADDYLVIHCLWVVGKSKGKGFGTLLLEQAAAAARAGGYKGLAMVASTGNWIASPDIFRKQGFARGAVCEGFEILTRRFDSRAPDPRFCGRFADKQKAMGPGLVVQRSDQCPYLDDAVLFVKAAAEDLGLDFRVEELKSAADVRNKSPHPYGVFSVSLDGRRIAHHYLLKKHLLETLKAA